MGKQNVIYPYNWILLSDKKEWNFAICSNMDGFGGYYAKWNKSEREDKYCIWYHLYVESKKHNKLVNIEKKTQTHRCRELVATSGEKE